MAREGRVIEVTFKEGTFHMQRGCGSRCGRTMCDGWTMCAVIPALEDAVHAMSRNLMDFRVSRCDWFKREAGEEQGHGGFVTNAHKGSLCPTGCTIGKPRATETYTVAQLESRGMVGIYEVEEETGDD